MISFKCGRTWTFNKATSSLHSNIALIESMSSAFSLVYKLLAMGNQEMNKSGWFPFTRMTINFMVNSCSCRVLGSGFFLFCSFVTWFLMIGVRARREASWEKKSRPELKIKVDNAALQGFPQAPEPQKKMVTNLRSLYKICLFFLFLVHFKHLVWWIHV